MPEFDIDAAATVAPGDREAEQEKFTAAATTVADRFSARASASTGSSAEVLAATAALAKDRAWLGTAGKLIAEGTPAAAATMEAIDQIAEMFTKLGGLMAERVTDLKDIRDRVVAELLGMPEPGIPNPDEPSILCADDLAPADTAGLDPARVIALATRLGGPSSHTAIIARQSLPCSSNRSISAGCLWSHASCPKTNPANSPKCNISKLTFQLTCRATCFRSKA